MSRTEIPTYTTGQVIDAAHANTYWRDNELAHWEAIDSVELSMKLIQKITLPSAAQFRFLDIPQTYKHLKLYLSVRSVGTNTIFSNNYVRLNEFGGTGGGSYANQRLYGQASTIIGISNASTPFMDAGSTVSSYFSSSLFSATVATFYNYAGDTNKSMTAFAGVKLQAATGKMNVIKDSSCWSLAHPIVTITIKPGDTQQDYVADSTAWLYGLI